MTMIDPVTSDAITAAMGQTSFARQRRSSLLSELVIAMGDLSDTITENVDPHEVNNTFLGYEHPLYTGLTDVLLIISELQGPLDFSPQMLAEQKLRRLRG